VQFAIVAAAEGANAAVTIQTKHCAPAKWTSSRAGKSCR